MFLIDMELYKMYRKLKEVQYQISQTVLKVILGTVIVDQSAN